MPAKRGYVVRRKSEARTRLRNCSGVSGFLVGGSEAGFDFTTPGGAAFAALRAAICASCLVAKSFAFASIISAGEPSSATRWS
jgi:hypothetical protein